MSQHSKQSLSPSRRQLVEVMQRLNFGHLEDLVVRNGEPIFSPAPRIVREHKFGGENGSRLEADVKDFLLKSQVVDLLNLLDEVRNGTIAMIEIKHGLPFRAFLSGTATDQTLLI